MAKFSMLLLAMLLAITGFDATRLQKIYDEVLYGDPGGFIMPVDDVFYISGRGLVATGIIETGKIKTGDSIEIVGVNTASVKAKVVGIEMFRKLLTEASKGENVGLLLSANIDKLQVKRGMVTCSPGAIQAHTEFKCQLTLKTKDDGGRSTPIFSKYRPFLRIRTHDVSGEVVSFEGKEELFPGESSVAIIKLQEPAAMEKDNEFVIREGGRVVGTGKVTQIIK